MKPLLRQAALLAVAAWLSWWLALRAPPPPAAPRTLTVRAPALELTPLPQASPDPAPQPVAVGLAPPAPLAPPPQRAAALDEPAPPAQQIEERLSLPAGPRVARTPPQSSAAAAAPAETRPPETTPAASLQVAASPPQPEPSPAPAAESAHASASVAEASEAPPGEAQAEQQSVRLAPDVAAGAPEPELGAPEGEPEHEAANAAAPETPHGPLPALSDVSPGVSLGVSPEDAPMRDAALLAEARDEFEHGQKQGFATVLLATPEDQLAIARYFGEELVLVPRRALDPREAHTSYFRVKRGGEARVEEVEAAPALEHYRQYRDLFDYEYGRLPLPLRELRRSVLARGEVYLFAALLSAEEWALVIARRRAALERSGREVSEVRRFVLRYLPLSTGAFDLRVEEIVFADGTRYRPAAPSAGG